VAQKAQDTASQVAGPNVASLVEPVRAAPPPFGRESQEEQRGVDEFVQDVLEFVRHHPLPSLLASFLTGWALTSVLRSKIPELERWLASPGQPSGDLPGAVTGTVGERASSPLPHHDLPAARSAAAAEQGRPVMNSREVPAEVLEQARSQAKHLPPADQDRLVADLKLQYQYAGEYVAYVDSWAERAGESRLERRWVLAHAASLVDLLEALERVPVSAEQRESLKLDYQPHPYQQTVPLRHYRCVAC